MCNPDTPGSLGLGAGEWSLACLHLKQAPQEMEPSRANNNFHFLFHQECLNNVKAALSAWLKLRCGAKRRPKECYKKEKWKGEN